MNPTNSIEIRRNFPTLNSRIAGIFIAGFAICCISLPVQCQTDMSSFKQVAAGFNGPRAAHAYYFDSASAIENSWLKHAFKPKKMRTIIAEINFRHQVLAVFAIGERFGVSKNIMVTAVNQSDSKDQSINANIQVGIVDNACKKSDVVSYPFVLAIIEKPKNIQAAGGFDAENFDAGCVAQMSGNFND